MKNLFKSFYNPTEEQLKNAWKSNSTLFIFDTNILLNIYGYKEQTKDDFFKLMKSISGKIWIPYHVALEYHRRRLDIIKNEKQILHEFKKSIEKITAYFNEITNSPINKRFPDLQNNTLKLKEDIQKLIEAHLAEIDKQDTQQPCVRSDDEILSKINTLFLGRVGDGPENQEVLESIYKDGEIRYEKKIPPGYEDKEKEKYDDFTFNGLSYKRKYGDLIIWKQIIEKANSNDIKNIIFITDDKKEDWWNIIDSRGKKHIGPHNSLREEIFREANIDLFHMYSADLFLKDGQAYSISNIQNSSIKDAEETAQKVIFLAEEANVYELHELESVYSKWYESKNLGLSERAKRKQDERELAHNSPWITFREQELRKQRRELELLERAQKEELRKWIRELELLERAPEEELRKQRRELELLERAPEEELRKQRRELELLERAPEEELRKWIRELEQSLLTRPHNSKKGKPTDND